MTPFGLRAPGLRLTPPGPDDVDDITLACEDPETAAWVTVPQPYAQQDAESFLTAVVAPGWADGTELTWAIRGEGSSAPLLGMIGLHGIGEGSAEVGFWVAPWARRQGVLTASLQAVLDHALSPSGLALQRVVWQAFVGNWPSRRAAWRAGFRLEGTIRLETVQRGVRRDSWVGTLLADDPRRPNEPWPAHAPRSA
ncbi:MAG TPA: GNAT family protein [Actinotalea sp.]